MIKAARMTAPTVTRFLAFVLFQLCAASGVRDVAAADDRLDDSCPSMVFYVFEQFVSKNGVEVTNVITAPTNGSFMDMKWGNLAATEMPIRKSLSLSSPIIGKSPSIYFRNKLETSYSILKLITLETRWYKGTLFAVADFEGLSMGPDNKPVGTEFAICGGTGDFRDASGYITVNQLNEESGEDHKTYKYEVFLYTWNATRKRLTFPQQNDDDNLDSSVQTQ